MLVIQDPTNEQSTYLLESLLDSFRVATRLAGAFAFASAAGVRLFTGDSVFRNLAAAHPVDLVIGIDAVTNNNALDALQVVSRDFPNVSVRAFVNPRREALFHPKFCWTKERRGGRVIAGSGNLTAAGLLGNWEAYSVETVDEASIGAVEVTWNEWAQRHAAALLPLDHAEVRRIAAENHILAQEGDLPTVRAPSLPSTARAAAATPALPPAARVLIAEIPRSGNRWKQANFHLKDYTEFFGAKPGAARLVVFRHVNADGTFADWEKDRPSVEVASHNYRFELAAAAGIDYPPAGRPIGVFIRVWTRTFYYRLILPDDAEYPKVRAVLDAREAARPNRMRSVRMNVAELRQEWPTAPFWEITEISAAS